LELSIGDTVVVPALGVGIVDANETVDVGEHSVKAYRIHLGEDAGNVWIPEGQMGVHGLREPVAEEHLERVWDSMTSQKAPKKRANWNRRRKRYDEMLASGEPRKVAALVGELAAVRNQKRTKKQTLSFGERLLLEKAQKLLAQEVAATRDCPVEVVRAEMDAMLAEA